MPGVTLLDLEKVTQLVNQQHSLVSAFGDLPNNMNYLLSNNVSKSNLFANALLQQFQSQNLSNKLFGNNIILNCIQANAAQHLLNAQASDNQKQINYSRYKTELCRQFIENGECKYGDKCQFAHGMLDLKDVNRHPKYKTDYCKTFHSKGFCPYGPRCHFIHELHEKFDPSIQNVSTKKTPKDAPKVLEDTQLIDKQIEAIQAQLASSLFVSEDTNDNFTVNDSKNQLADTTSDKLGSTQIETSFLSSPSSPVTSPASSNSASSFGSSTNSASVSSSTSPVNRAIKKFNVSIKNSPPQSRFEGTIRSIFESDAMPLTTALSISPRTRSSVSSTSSACSSSSSCSFEFNVTETVNSIDQSEVFSPVKQQTLRASFNRLVVQKNLGPIGRPQNQSPVVTSNSNIFDLERVNSLLRQKSNPTSGKKTEPLRNLLGDSQKAFFLPNEVNTFSYGQFSQSSIDRQFSW